MAKPPARRSSTSEINTFLQQSRTITEFVDKQARLIFAIDATASRQPTWDTACHLQTSMFQATHAANSLAIQLCYYRGFNQFKASGWLTGSDDLGRLMTRVSCEGGHTQIARLLRHALATHKETPIKALVFIGDAVEENPDSLCNLAGQCGIAGLPLFVFQEGRSSAVEKTFRTMAKVSRGAYAHFDQTSAAKLASLLGAVASYATGGRKALQNINTDGAKLLLRQLNT
ncbi:MAG: VWA domain-containing protein [Halieaceae bacterium]